MSNQSGKDQKYSRRIRMYKEDYISVCVFLNISKDGSRFYDTVIYRKIKSRQGPEYIRGANLKPKDLPIVIRLLQEAANFLEVNETRSLQA